MHWNNSCYGLWKIIINKFEFGLNFSYLLVTLSATFTIQQASGSLYDVNFLLSLVIIPPCEQSYFKACSHWCHSCYSVMSKWLETAGMCLCIARESVGFQRSQKLAVIIRGYKFWRNQWTVDDFRGFTWVTYFDSYIKQKILTNVS